MRRSCFTVIELIVVIATIAVLTAILLPALRNSRRQARAILCSSNMKQLLIGMLSYENENQTLPYAFYREFPMYPPPEGYAGDPTPPSRDKMGWWWFNFIEGFYTKYENKKNVISCPSRRINKSYLEDNILCGNYGVNQSIFKSSTGKAEFRGNPLRSSDISRSAETLLIVDSGYAMINWWHATNEPPDSLGTNTEDVAAYVPGLWINEQRVLRAGQKYDAIYGRHLHKTVNVGFADNHINRVKADTLFVEKTDDTYENKSPLWVPN